MAIKSQTPGAFCVLGCSNNFGMPAWESVSMSLGETANDTRIKVQHARALTSQHTLTLAVPAHVLCFALIVNYFPGLMSLFRMSVYRQEQRIRSPGKTHREMRHWQREDSSFLHRQRWRTAHLWSGRGFAGQRGDSCIFFSPHLNLNSILWGSYVPAWQGSGVICSAQTPGLSSCVPSQRFK